MARCPNCRVPCQDRQMCPRCGMEIKFIMQADARAQALVKAALTQITSGRLADAERLLLSAARINQTALCTTLLGFVRSGMKIP